MLIPSPVITLTANPLAEFTFKTPQWNPGQTIRATDHSFQFGGKGLNVAKMAARLGHQTTAIHFAGGALGQKCIESLHDQAYQSLSIPTEWETRAGLVINANRTPETTFLGPDQAVSLPDWERMLQAVQIENPASVLICGSIPGFSPAHAKCLMPFFNRWVAAGHHLFLDAYGPPLQELSLLPFNRIKINRHEWNLLNPKDASTEHPDFSVLPDKAPMTWIITDGPNLIHIWDRTIGTFQFTPPEITTEVSPTGSGDVFLATLQHSLSLNSDLAAAISLASDYAARNAAQSTIAEFSLS